jgi:hypothetical protein
VSSAAWVVVGAVSGAAGIGIDGHGGDAVGGETVVVVAVVEVEVERDDVGTVVDDELTVVDGSAGVAFLLLLHAPTASARQHPTTIAVRTHSSWHR